MGLDMYLSATKYVGNWNHSDPKDKAEYRRIIDALGLTEGDFAHMTESGQTVEPKVKVAYWRKANQIHKWFVDNCQNGEDDCRDAYVERDQLAELVRLCNEVLGTVETVEGEIHTGTSFYPDGRRIEHKHPGQVVAQVAIAERMLPAQGGFFFGSTDYDEYYLADLRDTVRQIEAVLNNPKFKGWEFEYRASW